MAAPDLELTARGLQRLGLERLAESLPEQAVVRKLVLPAEADLLAEEQGEAALVTIFQKCQTLEDVELQQTGLTARGLERLAAALPAQSPLRKVLLSSNGEILAEEQGQAALASIFEKSPALEEAALQHTGLTVLGLERLASTLPEDAALRTLSLLDKNKIIVEEKDQAALAKCLQNISSLKEVNLQSMYWLTTRGLERLAEALPTQAALQTVMLELWATEILADEQGQAALATIFAKSPALEEADLTKSGLTARGLERLAAALPTKAALRKLTLFSTKSLEEEHGQIALASIVEKSPMLDYLCLRETGLTAHGMERLAAAMPPEAVLRDLNLMSTKSLEEEQGRQATRRLVAHCRQLQIISLYGTGCPDPEEFKKELEALRPGLEVHFL